MEEYDNLFASFSKLGLDDKRNAYSNEVLKIALVLKENLNQLGLELIELPYNYELFKDKDKTESEMLDHNYRDLYILKTEILLLIEKLKNR